MVAMSLRKPRTSANSELALDATTSAASRDTCTKENQSKSSHANGEPAEGGGENAGEYTTL